MCRRRVGGRVAQLSSAPLRSAPLAWVAMKISWRRFAFFKKEALAEGNMEHYFPVAEQFRTQDEPAYCGRSTLVVALNALGIDPGRLWKGPWRWFNEDMVTRALCE